MMTEERILESVNEEVEESVAAQEEIAPEEPAAEEAPDNAEVIEQLQAELAAAQTKIEDLTDKLQRNAAEYQNSRRRQERQLHDEIERASSHLLRRLLPIIDDLNLAFANAPADVDESQQAWIDGFRQIQKKLLTLLADEGVTEMPADGPFDPTRHEAISSEADEQAPSGHIIETLRTGYEFKGRVLRPALVRVAA